MASSFSTGSICYEDVRLYTEELIKYCKLERKYLFNFSFMYVILRYHVIIIIFPPNTQHTYKLVSQVIVSNIIRLTNTTSFSNLRPQTQFQFFYPSHSSSDSESSVAHSSSLMEPSVAKVTQDFVGEPIIGES